MGKLLFHRIRFPEITAAQGDAVREEFGESAEPLEIVGVLKDPSLPRDQDQPYYNVLKNLDMRYLPSYAVDPETVNLGFHESLEAAIDRCQEHHDEVTDNMIGG
jgi:hypothetical protein